MKQPRIKAESLAIYTRQMAVLLLSGIPLARVVKFVARGDDPAMNEVMAEVHKKIEGGCTLAAGLAFYPEVFPSIYIGLVRVGEMSGRMTAVLSSLADLLEQNLSLRKRVVAVMTYPLFLTAACTGMVLVLMLVILPAMVPLLESSGVALPWPTRLIVFVYELPGRWTLLVPLALIGFVGALWVRRQLTSPGTALAMRTSVETVVSRMPLVGRTWHQSDSSRVLNSMALMLEVGVGLAAVLREVEQVATSSIMKGRIRKVSEALSQGQDFFGALEEHGVFDRGTTRMLECCGEAGEMGLMMRRVARIHDEEVSASLDNMASLLEPVTLFVMSAVVGFVTIATILPWVQLLQEVV